MTRAPVRQDGAALLTALALMLAVAIVGLSSVTAAVNDARSARREHDRQLAFHAADAALLDAERDIAQVAPSSPRFAAIGGAGFIDGCGKAGTENHGLCTRLPVPSWQAIDLAGDDAALVAYGTYTGRKLGMALAAQPRYLIELIPLDAAYGRLYRITALGFGAHAGTRVVLQSLYRQAPPVAGPPTTLPDKRIGWREVANWSDLHAATH